MLDYLLDKLATLAIVYQSNQSPEEIALLAEVFAEILAGEDTATLDKAFMLYLQNNKRFPTPAHIFELLPECRPRKEYMLIAAREETHTPGYGKQLCEAFLNRKREIGAMLKMDSEKLFSESEKPEHICQ